MDHQPRPGVPAQKGARDRLIRLAQRHPDWVLGFQDETWWSRLAAPAMHAWAAEGHPLRLVEQAVPTGAAPLAHSQIQARPAAGDLDAQLVQAGALG